MPNQYDDMIDRLLEAPYWIVDVLPERVPKDGEGQYFAVERYLCRPDRIADIHTRHAQVLLLLNCYYDMTVSFDNGEHWEKSPDPEEFARQLAAKPLRALFLSQDTMIDADPDDTYMTVYNPGTGLLEKLKQLAGAEGLFVWLGVQD